MSGPGGVNPRIPAAFVLWLPHLPGGDGAGKPIAQFKSKKYSEAKAYEGCGQLGKLLASHLP